MVDRIQIFVGFDYRERAATNVLIDSLYSWILEKGISKDRYEFQVLHGVPMQKKLKKLMDDGNTVRVYLPYGDNWYDYSVRRLKENPKMAGYIIKNLFSSIFRLK